MERGQDWCLDCGTAARGRLGTKGSWRAAVTIVALTLLLVSGAGLAGYAALNTDAEKTAAAPTQGNGNPVLAPAPGVPGVPGPTATTIAPGETSPGTTVTPGETGPGTTPPAVTQVLPSGTNPNSVGTPLQTPPANGPKIVVPPTKQVLPPTNQAVQPPLAPGAATAPKGSTTPATGTGTGTTVKPAVVTPQVIKLNAHAAKSYDPAKRAGAEIGPAANAVDGKPNTPWDVTVPADGNPIGVGLYVDLGAPYALQSLRIATSTPGYTAEIYGAVDAKAIPADVLDKRWQHLTDAKSVQDGAPIVLKGKGQAPKFQLLLVYVTKPGEPTDPRAAIGELTVRGTP